MERRAMACSAMTRPAPAMLMTVRRGAGTRTALAVAAPTHTPSIGDTASVVVAGVGADAGCDAGFAADVGLLAVVLVAMASGALGGAPGNGRGGLCKG